ncbi:LacI family transcriptional regulator [Mesorhizobium sp. M0621]|uniref:LacI family DNA-binding transcriptional regulator n=1 Tax=Mesorhizobium sp. M0621 TaxID=2956974 RepID=UPI003336A2B8
MTAKPTMNDVALRADVSLGTVSKVLNGDPTVGAELRDRVFDACAQLDYQHNRIAASLRSRQTRTIGIIIPDILNTFYAALVEKLENLASASGYTVMVVTTGEDAGRAAARIEILKQRQVDGMIVIPSLNASEGLEKTVGSGMPCVVVDRVSAENPFPSVATDNVDAAYQGTRYLLSLGHKHIALAANSPKLWNTQERIAGFEQAMREGQGRADVRIVGMTAEEARVSIGSLFREADRPTALFTANNLVTLGAVSAQLDCGIDIPSDVSLLAFDDFEWLRLLRPAISAIQQPIDQIAVDAWRLVFQQISKRPISGQHVRAGAQLVIRQSTAAIRGTSRRVG